MLYCGLKVTQHYDVTEKKKYTTMLGNIIRNRFKIMVAKPYKAHSHKINLLLQKTNMFASHKHLLKASMVQATVVDTNLKVNVQVFT